MIQSHEELEVYQMAFKAAMRIFEVSKKFPREETYSLTDQIHRSSRSVCSNIAEASSGATGRARPRCSRSSPASPSRRRARPRFTAAWAPCWRWAPASTPS